MASSYQSKQTELTARLASLSQSNYNCNLNKCSFCLCDISPFIYLLAYKVRKHEPASKKALHTIPRNYLHNLFNYNKHSLLRLCPASRLFAEKSHISLGKCLSCTSVTVHGTNDWTLSLDTLSVFTLGLFFFSQTLKRKKCVHQFNTT